MGYELCFHTSLTIVGCLRAESNLVKRTDTNKLWIAFIFIAIVAIAFVIVAVVIVAFVIVAVVIVAVVNQVALSHSDDVFLLLFCMFS